MIKVGIIGAGVIAKNHIMNYVNNPDVEVKAIADLSTEKAQQYANQYSIKNVYSDYQEILNDKEIDAVSICTPTFTHKSIVIEALNQKKHVLCEKPPALNADEVRECCDCAKKNDVLLMYGFVCWFRNHAQYLKKYIESGKMGKVLSGEAKRTSRCAEMQGWFGEKSKGGGCLRDVAIHELDLMLYFMGYPKVKSAVGFSTDVNTQLPSKLASGTSVWETGNKVSTKKDIENYISGYVTLENGSYIFLKSSFVLHTPNPGVYIEINGERAGACMEPFNKGKELYMVVEHDNLMHETKPNITVNDSYATEINHFVDCVANDTECICKADEAVMLMEVVDAIYKSSETGEAVVINE